MNKERISIRDKKKRTKLCPDCKTNLIYKKSQRCGKCCNKSSRNYAWKGDNAGYKAIHIWIRKNKPKPEFCEDCGIKPPTEVANISGKCKRDIKDYKWLCHKCHIVMDNIAEKSRLKQTIKLNIKKIKELRLHNKTYEEIGKEMGVSRNTIWRRLKK